MFLLIAIRSRVSVLASLGLDDDLIKLLIVRSPRIVHFHKNEILARIQWLRDSGVVRDDEELRQWLRKEPDFFNVPISVCEARIDWLSGVCAGNGSCDAKGGAAMLRAEPRILTQQSQALQLRAELWESMLGGSPSELVRVPHLFTCNLARTVMLRKAYCLLSGALCQIAPPPLPIDPGFTAPTVLFVNFLPWRSCIGYISASNQAFYASTRGSTLRCTMSLTSLTSVLPDTQALRSSP